MLTAYGLSHPGHIRKVNEDAWHVSIPLGVFAVADGMGGHRAGEVASALAIETIVSFMRSTQDADSTFPYPLEPQLSLAGNRLRMAIKLANDRVYREAADRPEYAGMGTTVVAAVVERNALVLGGVGDSRIYSLVGDRLVQLTTDDSWLRGLADSGSELEVNFATHPMRHAINKAIGVREELDVTILERTLQVDETLLLCSDGLHGELSDPEIAAILGADTGTPQLAERLIHAALDRRAPDNITAVVVRLEP